MVMSTAQAIILGVVQGLTEFLPVSSSAHLIIARKFLGIQDPGLAFDVFLHGATLLAVLILMGRALLIDFKRQPRLLLLLIIGTIPAGIVGIWAKDVIEGMVRNNLFVIGASLIIWSYLMTIADERWGDVDMKSLTIWDALIIGIFQAFALIPGTSRSGSTLTAGGLLRLDRRTAFRFSFYLSIPTIGGAFTLSLMDLMKAHQPITAQMWIGAAAALISGMLALAILRKTLYRFGLLPFAVYRTILGMFLIALFFIQKF